MWSCAAALDAMSKLWRLKLHPGASALPALTPGFIPIKLGSEKNKMTPNFRNFSLGVLTQVQATFRININGSNIFSKVSGSGTAQAAPPFSSPPLSLQFSPFLSPLSLHRPLRLISNLPT